MGVARAWLVGYNAVVTVGAMVLTGAGIALAAHQMVPTATAVAVPLGMLAPAVIAMLSGLGVANRLPTSGRFQLRVFLARAAWSVIVVLAGGIAASIVQITYPVTGAAAVTMALVACTFASSTLLGRGAPVVGAGVFVVVILNSHAFHALGSEMWLANPVADVAVIAVPAPAIALYAWFGGRTDARLSR